MGDISPIKLSWANNNGPPVEPRRSIDDLLSGYHSLEATASWKFQHRFEYGTSNPFFVIRSSKKAFAGCKYQLPCLSGDDVCQVNVSEHGQIHHYRGPEVSWREFYKSFALVVSPIVPPVSGNRGHPD